MMRFLAIVILLGFAFFGGMVFRRNTYRAEIEAFRKTNARLEKLESLEPDVGDSMRELQFEMGKLWFAEKFHNEALALFELKEMRESVETVDIIQPMVNGVNVSGVLDAMVNSQIAGMESALKHHDETEFKKQYGLTMETCNMCHRTTGYGFNQITIPSAPPVFNQQWRPVP